MADIYCNMKISEYKTLSWFSTFSSIPTGMIFKLCDNFYIKLGDEQKDSGCLNPNLTIRYMDYDPVYKNAYCISFPEFRYFKPDEDIQIVSKITFNQE